MDKTPEQKNGKEMNASAMAATSVITVVTVVLNAAEHLSRTISSVLEQTWDGVELIIIDGGSTDGTVSVIKDHVKDIDRWSSEPDRGIYDAMNKGIDRATGEWIIFLNAGDEFADAQVLSRLIPELRDDIDVLYGRHEEPYGNKYSRKPPLGNMKDLWKGMVFCHQSMLVRTTLMKRFKFDIQNSIAADFEFIASLQAEQRRFHSVDIIISRVLSDGYSSSNNLAMIREQWLISKRYFGHKYTLDVYYVASLASVSLKNLVKRCLPRRMANYLRARQGR